MPHVLQRGLRIEYQSFGAEEDPALLLIAGLGAQMLQWPRPLCQLLAGHGFRVLRFDNRDSGLSTRLRHLGTPDLRRAAAAWRRGQPIAPPYGLHDMADDCIGLMDALGLEQAHLCGASVGGMVAQSAALRHRHRLHSLTSIMSAPGSHGLPVATKIALSSYSEKASAKRETFIEQTLQLCRALAGPRFPMREDYERDRAEKLWHRGIHTDGTARQLLAFYAYGCQVEKLARLRLPTLVIHGDADPLLPLAAGRRTAQSIPGARLVVYRGMGHDLPQPLWRPLARAIASQPRTD